jgi:transcriptional regulator with XRE-family HTH domain
MNLLQVMLTEYMKKHKLSTRDVARLANVSHTTVARAMNGHSLNIRSLLALCRFLDINPNVVIGDANNISVLEGYLEQYPELKEVLIEAVRRLADGNISPSVIEDIVAYIKYRINFSNIERT